MKRCKTCNVDKSNDEFYTGKDITRHCKECMKSIWRDRWKKRNFSKESRKNHQEAKNTYKKNNPIKTKCHERVDTALDNGSVKKMPCEICGKKQVEAHHDDYSKPIEVRWLCRIHHKQHHAKHGSGING